MKPPHKRMVYQTGATRLRIVTAARDLFTEKGLFDTQMLDIASALSMSRTTLYRYFQDKLDLALAILPLLMSEISGAWNDPGPTAGSARTRLGMYLAQVWANTEQLAQPLKFLAEFDAFFSGSRIPVNFRERVSLALATEGDSVILDLLREGQSDGSIRTDLEPHLTMATLLNSVRGLQQRLSLRGDALVEVQPHERGRVVVTQIQLLLRGVSP